MTRGRYVSSVNRRGGAVLVAVAALLAVGSVAFVGSRGVDRWTVALAFLVFVAGGELARVTLPGNREAAPLGLAVALAYALLGNVNGAATRHSVAQVVSVAAVGVLVGALPHVAVQRAPRLDDMARRVLTVAFAAMLFRPAWQSGLLDGLRGWQLAGVLLAGMVLTLAMDAVLGAMIRAGDDAAPFLPTLRDEVRALLGMSAAIGATGLLIALAARTMGVWALPVFTVPLLLTQFAFRRYAAIRSTYLQTIRSLSRVTEVGGYTESGHALRVSELAVAVGRDLGIPESALLDLEYAALMHDIGQLSLSEPVPGGATVVVSPEEQQRIASLGAEVIRETGVLDRVAVIVERQADPYRRAHQNADPAVPLASRIIRAVNAYDDVVGDTLQNERRLAALEQLRLGMAYEYDPVVVASLSRVVERSLRR